MLFELKLRNEADFPGIVVASEFDGKTRTAKGDRFNIDHRYRKGSPVGASSIIHTVENLSSIMTNRTREFNPDVTGVWPENTMHRRVSRVHAERTRLRHSSAVSADVVIFLKTLGSAFPRNILQSRRGQCSRGWKGRSSRSLRGD